MNTLRYLLLCLAVLSLHSCDNMTEEIHLNENGSGEYKVYADMIPGIRMMATQISGLLGDSTGQEQMEQVDDAAINEYIWKDFPEGEIDSVFDYRDALDSADVADPKNKELLDRMKGFMQGGREKGYLNMGAKMNFRDMADLQALTRQIEDNQKKEAGGGENDMLGMGGLGDMKTETKYAMKGGVFTRATKIISKPKIKEDEMGMFEMMFGTGKITTIVYLPKKLKAVKGEYLVLKEENKVVFEYPMMDYMLGKVTNNFEIVMEN